MGLLGPLMRAAGKVLAEGVEQGAERRGAAALTAEAAELVAARAATRAGTAAGTALEAEAVALVRRASVEAARARITGLAAAGASDAEATALLNSVVTGTRRALFASSQTRAVPPTMQQRFSPGGLQGACGFSQSVSQAYLDDLGVQSVAHQAIKLFGQGPNHAFAVARMPNGKNYLVDATFAQFTDPRLIGPGQTGVPGHFLRSSAAGRELLDGLLERGYVELTDDVAALYGRALGGKGMAPMRAADFLARDTMVNGIPRDRVADFMVPLR